VRCHRLGSLPTTALGACGTSIADPAAMTGMTGTIRRTDATRNDGRTVARWKSSACHGAFEVDLQTRLGGAVEPTVGDPGFEPAERTTYGVDWTRWDQRLFTQTSLVNPPTSRILVIDDDEAVRTAFQLALDDFPTELVLAADAFVGLDVFSRVPIDLVFLDLKMPGMDGVSTLHRLRTNGANAAVCIMTGYAEEYMAPLIDAAAQEIEFELFRKPLEMQDIRTIAWTLLADTPQ
jgi:CheY-like chemotaxis protein